MGDLTGRVAVVTGAASGIGHATAFLLAQHGVRVAVLDRNDERARKAAEEITQAGHEAKEWVVDVADEEKMGEAMQQIWDCWGRMDIVFANAGINGVFATLEDLTLEDWSETLTTNLTGTFVTIKAAFPYLKEQGAGSIIVTSSTNGTRCFGLMGATAYSVSKAGQVALVKMLALELAPANIRVNVICPGSVGDTNIKNKLRGLEKIKFRGGPLEDHFPLSGNPARAAQIAETVVFLASDASAYVTGTEIWIDGAYSLAAGVVLLEE